MAALTSGCRCREEGKFGNTEITREEVHAQAFARFGVAQEYQTRLQEWELLRNRDAVWKFASKRLLYFRSTKIRSRWAPLLLCILLRRERF